METLEAMRKVSEALTRDDIGEAQLVVLEAERVRCTLPSSYFERVLQAALRADCLTPEYSEFCRRAYGLVQYRSMCAQALKGGVK